MDFQIRYDLEMDNARYGGSLTPGNGGNRERGDKGLHLDCLLHFVRPRDKSNLICQDDEKKMFEGTLN